MNSEYASFGKSRKRCNLAAASIAINAVLLIAGLIAFMNMPADLGRAMTTGSRAQTRAFAAPVPTYFHYAT